MNCHQDIFDPANRKKRRGIIEKRRRDRINNCLAELKHLVPLAHEKETSSKLEKAEILQLTVDYLKLLQKPLQISSKVLNSQSPSFQDCILEVSRYLVNIEGLDFNHPLRSRLIHHLQNFTNNKHLSLDQPHNYTPINNISNCTDFRSSFSSSCSSSTNKFDLNNFPTTDKQTNSPHYSSNQKPPKVVNNSAFVQINITANNNDEINWNNNFPTTNDNYPNTLYWNENQNHFIIRG